MHESPEFVRQAGAGPFPTEPLRHALHIIAQDRPRFRDLGAGVDHLLCGHHLRTGFPDLGRYAERKAALWLSTTAAVVVIAVTPFVGLWSDRIGRRPVLLALALGSAALPISMFALMSSGSHVQALLGACALAALAGGVSAVGAVATAEQFPGEGRVTGLALGATMATAVFGGLTP